LLQMIDLDDTKGDNADQFLGHFKRQFRGLPLNGFRMIQPHRFAGQIQESVTANRFGYLKGKRGESKVGYLPCPYLWHSLTITWDGKIVPCCMAFEEKYILGQVQQNKILDVWNSKKMQNLRRKIKEKKYEEVSLCRNCDLLWQRQILGISIKNLKDLITFIKESISS